VFDNRVPEPARHKPTTVRIRYEVLRLEHWTVVEFRGPERLMAFDAPDRRARPIEEVLRKLKARIPGYP
jgi:hypothetical protein